MNANPGDAIKQQANDAERKKREEEERRWREQVAEYHKSRLGFLEWVKLDARAPDDPAGDTPTMTGITSGGGRLKLADGLYERKEPFTVKRWWPITDDEYPIQIRVKDGQVSPTALKMTGLIFKDFNLRALDQAHAACQDALRRAGAETVLISIGPPNGHVHFRYAVDREAKELELEGLIKNAERTGLAIEFSDSMKGFLDNYATELGTEAPYQKLGPKIGQLAGFLGFKNVEALLQADPEQFKGTGVKKQQWFYNKRDQLAVNPEGEIRAMEFKNITKSLSDGNIKEQLQKKFVDDKMTELQTTNPGATEAEKKIARETFTKEANEKYRDPAKVTEEYLRTTLDGPPALTGDKRLEALSKELEKIEQRFDQLDAHREKIEKSLDKFEVAAKGKDPAMINWDKIESKLGESQVERNNLLDGINETKKDVMQAKSALLEEMNKLQLNLTTQNENLNKQNNALSGEKKLKNEEKEKLEKDYAAAKPAADVKLKADDPKAIVLKDLEQKIALVKQEIAKIEETQNKNEGTIKNNSDTIGKIKEAVNKSNQLQTKVDAQQTKFEKTKARNQDIAADIRDRKDIQQRNVQGPQRP